MLKITKKNKKIFTIFLRYFLTAFFIFTISIIAFSQKLPKKIRGYKVYSAEITVGGEDKSEVSENDLRVEFDFNEPQISDFSLAGITLSLNGAVTVFGQSGTVDFITFRDFSVNKIPVQIAEYKKSFDFTKNEAFKLEKPVEIFVNTTQTLRGMLAEKRESKEKWKVIGKVFVFGRFRKFGFKFKRVIPINVNTEIENPIRRKIEPTN